MEYKNLKYQTFINHDPIYFENGAHFKYNDLYTKLVKLESQQKKQEKDKDINWYVSIKQSRNNDKNYKHLLTKNNTNITNTSRSKIKDLSISGNFNSLSRNKQAYIDYSKSLPENEVKNKTKIIKDIFPQETNQNITYNEALLKEISSLMSNINFDLVFNMISNQSCDVKSNFKCLESKINSYLKSIKSDKTNVTEYDVSAKRNNNLIDNSYVRQSDMNNINIDNKYNVTFEKKRIFTKAVNINKIINNKQNNITNSNYSNQVTKRSEHTPTTKSITNNSKSKGKIIENMIYSLANSHKNTIDTLRNAKVSKFVNIEQPNSTKAKYRFTFGKNSI